MPTQANFICPHCNEVFSLSAQYVADYGGQEIRCSNCKQPTLIPRSLKGRTTETIKQFWREDNLLAMGIQAHLPDRCIKCNQPASGKHQKVTVTWTDKTPSVMQGAAAAVITAASAKKAIIAVPLCSSHKLSHRLPITLMSVLALGGVGIFVLGMIRISSTLWTVGAFMILAGLAAGLFALGSLNAAYIDGRIVKLARVHPDFLKEIPVRELMPQASKSAESSAFDQIR